MVVEESQCEIDPKGLRVSDAACRSKRPADTSDAVPFTVYDDADQRAVALNFIRSRSSRLLN
jgi:hypothetical protein